MNKRDLYIKAQAASTPSGEWVRNPDWLPLDDIQSGDNKFSGLWAVYESIPATQWFYYQIGGSSPSQVDYGDGNTQTASNLVLYEHQYDYSTLSGPILVDPELGNYKMVVINIQFATTTTSLLIDRNGTNVSGNSTTGWLDIIFDCPTVSVFNISSQRRPNYMQRLIVLSHIINNPNSVFTYLFGLRVFGIELPLATNFQSTFRETGDIKTPDGEPFSLSSNLSTQFNSTFSNTNIENIGTISSTSSTAASSTFSGNSNLKKIENINLPAVTNATSMLNACTQLEEIETINMPNVENATNMFLNCRSLKYINIDLPNLTTTPSMFNGCWTLKKIDLSTSNNISGNVGSMFQNCFLVQEITLGDLSLVTSTSNLFINNWSLQILRVPNIKVSFSLLNTSIEAPEMVTVFNDLADLITLGLPSATITITGTPAAVNLTPSERAIATDKGWTIVG